ncbi:unnamed protein product [Heterobilharzia americana]|nr:unnamed protein product [Heterobilharzia americana]
MDDDELTQEILDQFDLICTQHQYENASAHITEDSSKLRLHSDKSSSFLTRSTSLDTKLNGSDQVSHFPRNDKILNTNRDEVERLKKELSVLREELYMKLGELATIKESASRAKATDSDTISKLESHLASERSDFQRKLSELNAQIAFREADYRLVCSELARFKEEAAVNKQLLNERSLEYSPASQILVSLTSPNPDFISNRKVRTPVSRIPSADFHLPAPVTPVPSRRHKVPHGLTWNVNITNDFEDKLNSSIQKDKDANELLPVDDTTLSSTPRKRQRCVVSPDTKSSHNSPEHVRQPILASLVDACVETSDVLTDPANSRTLCYRIMPGTFSNIKSSHELTTETSDLLSELLDLSISIPQNDKRRSTVDINSRVPSFSSCSTNPEDSAWITSDYYLTGISRLLPCYSDTLNQQLSTDSCSLRLNRMVKRFSDSVPYLMLRIEEQLKACIRALSEPCSQSVRISGNRYHPDLQEVDDEALKEEGEEEENENERLNMEISDFNSHEISYLGEDPFEGAPASQTVTSLTFPSQPRYIGHFQSVNHTAADVNKTNDDNSCSLYRQIMVNQSIRGINQMRYLVTLLASCCQMSPVSSYCSFSNNSLLDDNLLPIVNEIQHLIRMTSTVSSQFINKLVDVFIQNEGKQNLLSPMTTVCNPAGMQHELIGDGVTLLSCSVECTPYQQSQYTSKQKVFPSLSIILPLITSCLNLAALFAIFIQTDNHSLENAVDQVCGAVGKQNTCTDSVTWFPQLLNCIIITSEACFGQDDTLSDVSTDTKISWGSSSEYASSVNTIKTRTIITLKPLISFLRLWKNMISQKHWNGGHCSDSWWNLRCEKLDTDHKDSTLPKDIREQYIERLFGASIRCRLLALCVWICQFSDQLNQSTIVLDSSSHNYTELYHSLEMQKIELLAEFSGFIAVLTQRDDVVWPDNCCCKAQVYSTLVHLAADPLQILLTTPTSFLSDPFCHYHQQHMSSLTIQLMVKQKICLIAFGQLTRALIGLLWRHGDQSFQSYTDCLPDYFCLIANLSRWIQQYHQQVESEPVLELMHNDTTLRPELVEELYDFESGLENPSNSNVF